MSYVKKIVGITLGVAAGLFVLNYATRSFMPGLRGYFGLSA